MGLQQPVYPDAVPYWLQFDNDSLGLEIDGEWDDKSSYGLKGGASFLDGRLLSALSYTGYTSRGDEDKAPCRFDKLDLGLAWRPDPLLDDNWRLTLIPGGGFLILGNLGGYTIQSEWHELVGVERPIPDKDSYIEADDGAVDGEAYAFTEVQLVPEAFPWLHLDSALRLETTGLLLANIGFSVGVDNPEKVQLISLLYQNDILTRKNSPFPPSVMRDDLRVGLDLRAGGLYAEKATSVFEDRLDGSIGFIFGGPSGDLPSHGKTERMDVGNGFLRPSPLVRWSWELNFLGWEQAEAERFWLFLQYQSGWQGEHKEDSQIAKRFSSLCIGMESHFFLDRTHRFDPYAGLAFGFSDFRKLKADLEVAETEENKLVVHLNPHLGLRVELPTRRKPFTYSIAVEGGGLFKIDAPPEFIPELRVLFGCRLN